MGFKYQLTLNAIQLILSLNLVASDPVVNTTSGAVRGQTLHVLNKSINQFLGIPFAEPPVRFAKPVAITTPSESVIDGTKPGKSCFQMERFVKSDEMSEDCLVLNVWTPSEWSPSKLYPVMFWIYGGGFVAGSISQPEYNGTALATEDVVFVAANYRLNAFGFFYYDEPSVPNVGLHDQIMALEWVRENIHQFGGNKDEITLFGESAGSGSISAHILSPDTKGLFKRAILQSGAALQGKDKSGVSVEESRKLAVQLATEFGCYTKDWFECLRKVDANKLANSKVRMGMPTWGTELLPYVANKAFELGKFNKDIDVMAGVNKNEGSLILYGADKSLLTKNLTAAEFATWATIASAVTMPGVNILEATKLYTEGVDTEEDPAAIRWKLIDFLGDMGMSCPAYFFTKRYAAHSTKGTNVFFYELTQKAQDTSFLSTLIPSNIQDLFGVFHAADVPLVFGLPLLKTKNINQNDIEFSKQVMKLWTDFAKNGKPEDKWETMLTDSDVNKVKNLKPNSTEYTEYYHKFCDGFWKNYF